MLSPQLKVVLHDRTFYNVPQDIHCVLLLQMG